MKEALKLALDALESMAGTLLELGEQTTFNEDQAITAIKAALAQPAQKPVRWWDEKNDVVYTHCTHESDDYHGFERTVPLYPHRPPQKNT
jgi:hypothetical protein